MALRRLVRVLIPRKSYEAELAPPAPDGSPDAVGVPLADGALFVTTVRASRTWTLIAPHLCLTYASCY